MISGVARAGYNPGGGNGGDSLTVHGITLYGVIDVNLTYETHGESENAAYPVGIDYLIIGAKNANRSVLTLAPNGMNGSKLGLKGVEPILDGWSGVFRVECEFNPLSGQLDDGLKSMVEANGVPLSQQRSAWGDSNKAGQLLNGDAFAGVTNIRSGTLTVGRHPSLTWDNLRRYDPLHGSLAFSLLGYSGQPAGAGDTEDRFLDKSIKYLADFGTIHAGALYAFRDDGDSNGALQLDLGLKYRRISFDGIYSRIKDAVSASPLTTNATGTLSPAQVAAIALGGFSEGSTLAATISDNRAWLLSAGYDAGALKIFLGYEHIDLGNPSEPLTTDGTVDGFGVDQTIGGYDIITNNAGFPRDKTVRIYWGGARYDFTAKFEMDVGYYHLSQNNYATSAALVGCNSAVSAQCSGAFNSVAVLAYYNLAKRFDLYGGAAWSQVLGGVSSGYLHDNTIDPSIGLRIIF